MAIAIAGAGTAGTQTLVAGSGGGTVSKPTAVNGVGFLLCADFIIADPSTVITPPSGWVAIASAGYANAGGQLRNYYKISTAADSGATSYTWSAVASVYTDIIVCAFTGTDLVNPIEVGSVNSSSTATTTPAITSLSTQAAGDALMCCFGVGGAGAASAVPSGHTKLADLGDGNIYTYNPSIPAGATGALTATFGVSGTPNAEAWAVLPPQPFPPWAPAVRQLIRS